MINKSILIHATNSINNLIGIISSSSLRLSYSKEDFCIGSKKISSAAHPMVCFCEHQKELLSQEVITYGKYGVAFTKDWGLKKRVSPVLYVDDNSLAAKGIATLLKARQNKETKIPSHLRLPIMEIKCFTKNVRGYNSYLEQNNFDFKNENEWRYVPRVSDIDNNLISQNQSTYKKNPNKYNKKLQPYPLRFKHSDIDTIFVSNENEVQAIRELLSSSATKIEISTWKDR
jgi:hypothetical protein